MKYQLQGRYPYYSPVIPDSKNVQDYFNKTKELLKTYITLLKIEGISVEKAFLYGSYSTDTATDSSDIDLMIVTNNADADDLVIGKIWKLTRKINTRIEPFLVGIDRFNKDNHSPLIDFVKKRGIEIAAE